MFLPFKNFPASLIKFLSVYIIDWGLVDALADWMLFLAFTDLEMFIMKFILYKISSIWNKNKIDINYKEQDFASNIFYLYICYV